MEFILCDIEKMEVKKIPEEVSIDFDIGGENDVQIVCDQGLLSMGMWIICPGTEYAALIEEAEQNTNSKTETWMGNGLRKFLQEFIIEPPAGQDYRKVSGDAHTIMRQVLNGAFGNLFYIPEEPSGITLNEYKFDRYTDALAGFEKMLKTKKARINLEVKQGEANEPFSVILSATPIQNLASEIEYSQDSKINITIKEYKRGINHLICLGKGELKDRQVLHLYVQFDGSISTNGKHYIGLEERTAIYDNSSAEDLGELKEGGIERLKELMDYRKMSMTVQDVDLQIGDIIAGRNYETGLYLQKPVVQKIVKVESGETTVEYKVEGEE